MPDPVVYTCTRCAGPFTCSPPDAESEADAEATLLFGVPRSPVPRLCNECFTALMKPGDVSDQAWIDAGCPGSSSPSQHAPAPDYTSELPPEPSGAHAVRENAHLRSALEASELRVAALSAELLKARARGERLAYSLELALGVKQRKPPAEDV
jgi:hypothetical protein